MTRLRRLAARTAYIERLFLRGAMLNASTEAGSRAQETHEPAGRMTV